MDESNPAREETSESGWRWASLTTLQRVRALALGFTPAYLDDHPNTLQVLINARPISILTSAERDQNNNDSAFDTTPNDESSAVPPPEPFATSSNDESATAP